MSAGSVVRSIRAGAALDRGRSQDVNRRQRGVMRPEIDRDRVSFFVSERNFTLLLHSTHSLSAAV